MKKKRDRKRSVFVQEYHSPRAAGFASVALAIVILFVVLFIGK